VTRYFASTVDQSTCSSALYAFWLLINRNNAGEQREQLTASHMRGRVNVLARGGDEGEGAANDAIAIVCEGARPGDAPPIQVSKAQ
jgi:hypothetical protein